VEALEDGLQGTSAIFSEWMDEGRSNDRSARGSGELAVDFKTG
jgi:hypothetical protein